MLIFPRMYLVNPSNRNKTFFKVNNYKLVYNNIIRTLKIINLIKAFELNQITLSDDNYIKNKVFGTIKDSFLNLLYLITTSNNPDGKCFL